MSFTRKEFTYYNFSRVYSLNCQYNFILGNRGAGKTYGAKKKGIKDAIRTGIKNGFDNCDQFIYLRRYKPEIVLAKMSFFADLNANEEFPDWDFRAQGNEMQISPATNRNDKNRVWKCIGYFIALVNGQNYKGVSFPRVKTIIFDEFIIEKGHQQYLNNEPTAMLNFYVTVDRNQDKTRVLFLANSVSITNPYFIEYEIEPKQADKDGFIKSGFPHPVTKQPFVAVHFIQNTEYKKEVYNTRIGGFIAGTDYGAYAVDNEFHDNHDALIEEKTPDSEYLFTLEAKAGTFSVWYDAKQRQFYATSKRPKKEVMFTLLPEKMSEEKTLVDFTDKMMGRLRTAYRHANVRFNKAPVRNAFVEIFKR
jgi:hypothetical protein